MKTRCFLLSLAIAASANIAAQQVQQQAGNCPVNTEERLTCHPWYGKRVGFIGDSMTDPANNKQDIPYKYWHYLSQMLAIKPYVYGKSGRQWDDVPRQADLLYKEHGDSVDAVIVFIGTNDFNAGVPLGRWYDEREDTVTAAVHGAKKTYTRKRRIPSIDQSTMKGRINIALIKLKTYFPDKQIVLLTPIHRAYATFSDTNIQPDESWQNLCGEYFSAYVDAVKEAGNVWGVPVIDLNSVSGLNPMVAAQQHYFHDKHTDLLHPGTKGQQRIAQTLVRQLASLPVF